MAQLGTRRPLFIKKLISRNQSHDYIWRKLIRHIYSKTGVWVSSKTNFIKAFDSGWEIKHVTTRGHFLQFSKFFAPNQYFCAQFCVRPRGILPLSRGKFACGPCLFPNLVWLIVICNLIKQQCVGIHIHSDNVTWITGFRIFLKFCFNYVTVNVKTR